MNSNALISRWKEGEGASAHNAVLRALQQKEPIFQLTPFGTIDKRADFRGFPAGSLRGISGAIIDSIDFGCCDLSHVRMNDCKITNSVFSHATLNDAKFERSQVKDCLFRKASLKLAHLGVKRVQYVNCTFDRCNFARVIFHQAEFDDCTFDNCRLKGIDFGAASFVRGAFIGPLEEVWFHGRDPFLTYTAGPAAQFRTNEMAGVSFAKARLSWVTFSDNCNLSTVVLPEDGQHLYFDNWAARLQAVSRTVENGSNEDVTRFLHPYLLRADCQSEYILNRQDVVSMLGSEVGEKVLNALASA